MTILGIDTSSAACSCALTRDGKLICESVTNSALTHSQTIMPMVERMLEREGLTPSDVDLFSVVTGPGSFTGVRIGVCAVKALCLATDKPCAAIDALHAIAEGCAFDGYISPILDARRNQVYTALFRRENGRLARVSKDEALPLNDWLSRLKEYGRVCFTGDGLNTYEKTIKDVFEGAIIAPMHIRVLRASAACFIAENEPKTHTTADKLVPIYLRLPQAERERNERLTRRRA